MPEVEINTFQNAVVVKLRTKEAAEAYADVLYREASRTNDVGFREDAEELFKATEEVWPSRPTDSP
jgi:hypothetical protein